MKRKMFFVTLSVPFLAAPLLLGCQGSVDETPDGYVDALPAETKDGTILQAFCWTYNDVKSQLPYIANAGFKSVQLSPVQVPKSGGSSWWAFYQPLAFRIADNGESALGTKAELKALCEEADKYNISILVDAVLNHMANDGLDSEDPGVFPEIENYEPYIYQHRDELFHHNLNPEGSGSDTQKYPDLPDLNTGDPYIQGKALAFLKECIDVGVDGFRFDAAKHIETPDDPNYPSNFWPNTLGKAKEYYKEKTGHELFSYGEILGKPVDRSIDVYTKYMRVTATDYGTLVSNAGQSKDGEQAAKASYGVKTDASNLVTWVESHDMYTTKEKPSSHEHISRTWAVVNSRKDTVGMYLARSDNNKSPSVGIIGDYFYRKEVVGAVNRFRNRFVGAEESQGYDEMVYFNERYTDNAKGAIVVDFARNDETKVKFEHLGTGVYYDQITGKAVTVRNGKATIEMGESGIAVLTMSKNKARPEFEADSHGGLFAVEKNVKVTYKNAETATYQINDGAPVNFKSGNTINIKESDAKDGKIDLKITVSTDEFTVSETYKYQVVSLIDGYFNFVNINPNYFTHKEIYMWSWKPGENGKWSKNYTIQGNTILVDVNTLGLEGMVFGLFEDGYVITNLNEWDYNVQRQTTDITGAVLQQGYYDGSNF